MRPRNLILVAISILASTTILCNSSAHTIDMEGSKFSNLELLLDRSKMVFVGRVVRVDFSMSETHSKNEVSLPHTFVTYQIKETIHGKPFGGTFSMRFLGGPDGRGEFLMVSNVPLFQVGDEDLLFVSSNGEDGCPLVLCEWGRYRILGGRTYNARGVPVQKIDETHVIARGMPIQEFQKFSYPSPTFDNLLKNEEFLDMIQLLQHEGQPVDHLRRRYENGTPDQIQLLLHVSHVPTKPDLGNTDIHFDTTHTAEDPGPPIAIEQFIATVSSIAKSKNRAAQDPLRSIDTDGPFFAAIRSKRVEPPAPQTQKASAAKPQSPEEAAESEALRIQNFNPVVK